MAVFYAFLLLTVLLCAENGIAQAPSQALCHKDWTSHEGSCYAYVDVDMTWSEAQAFCLAFDARLAEPQTASKYNFLKHLAESRNDVAVWVGGTDAIHDGTWQWASTKSLIYPYTNWAAGEPNNLGGKESCMNLWRGHGYKWNDSGCQYKSSFICEYRQ